MVNLKKNHFEELEMIARDEVKENLDGYFNRLSKTKREDYVSDYLNTITHIFDPHSGYFGAYDKEQFDMQMSGSLEGIGARLQTDGELTKVTSIVPGGPAWKGKELEAGDYILKVTQGIEDEGIDITGMRIDEVVKKIRGKKGTEVILMVKKVDGSVIDISIIRDVVILEESFARSLILEDESNSQKIGYIKLPRFYADFNHTNGSSCSKDVADEIDKLKAKKIDGIILDLRNNGGGSLKDVVKMTGLFIEEGPIVQVKSRMQKPIVLSDKDNTVQYDGPLVILVNNFSASASEILAAALQDYERAVIIGSNSTFGKGTVQRFLNLDRAFRGHNEIKPLGEVKVTIQKFFRVNGGSTQLKGVVPDIILPNNWHYIKTGEKENEFAMEWTEINPLKYDQKVYNLKSMELIKAKSQSRIENNEMFKKVLENADRLKKRRDDNAHSLNFEKYRSEQEILDEEAALFKDIFSPIEDLKVNNLKEDFDHIHQDSSRIARNEDWINSVSKDIYIDEAMHVLHDMIEIQ